MTYGSNDVQNHVLRLEILQTWSYFLQKSAHLFDNVT
jgi:hypothetical protein